MSKIRFLGLDVHAATIAIAVAEPNGEVRSVGVIPNRLESIRKAMAKLGPAKQLKACYEARPDRVRSVLAVDTVECALRRDCAVAGAGQNPGWCPASPPRQPARAADARVAYRFPPESLVADRSMGLAPALAPDLVPPFNSRRISSMCC